MSRLRLEVKASLMKLGIQNAIVGDVPRFASEDLMKIKIVAQFRGDSRRLLGCAPAPNPSR
jgi:hypothetical protein